MNPALKYAWLAVRHKWFVLLAGLRIGCPIGRLLAHDLLKFSRAELPHYGRQFFGDRGDPDGFAAAWLHHQNRNDHHWEYWIPRTAHNRDDPEMKPPGPMEMPHGAVLEMVADWVGACRAYEGRWPRGSWEWYERRAGEIELHPATRRKVEAVVAVATGVMILGDS